jgi:hypothetical protein
MTTAFPPSSLSQLAEAYPEAPMRIAHDLVGHPLLTLDRLVALAQRLPADAVEYNQGNLPIGIDPKDIPVSELSAADTIRDIETNGAWMVLKFIEHDADYKALLEDTLGVVRAIVEPRTGPMLTLQGFIFVSATGATTPFHFDPEHNILMQISGTKTFTIFPQSDENIVAPDAHERFHMGEQHRNLAWQPDFLARGTAFDLAPGDALHVPVKAPHFVQVTSGPSVSLSVTWRSEWSYREADARAFNRLLRKAGLSPASPGRWPVENNGKSIAYRAIRKARQAAPF